MGGCSVFGCNNDMRKKKTPDSSFHKFPKGNLNLSKQWTLFCKRKDQINIRTARICSLHFVKNDFTNNTKFEMGFTAYHLLKHDAVPTVYLNKPSIDSEKIIKHSTERSKRMELKKKKEIVNELLEVPLEFESENENEQETADDGFNGENIPRPELTTQQAQIDELTDQVKTLREENDALKKKLLVGEKTIETLEAKVTKVKFQQSNLEEKLLQIFTRGQIRKLKLGLKKRSKWSEEDIARSITLYSASSRAYKLLRKKNFPLPAIRTLQTWAQKLDITPGIMMPITKIMKAAQELTQNQKLCVLSFDEMKVKEAYCYDRTSDSTLKPASYVQVGMLRGLVGKWKQPIFYDFDCKMTKSILFNIVETVGSCGFTVVAITSDLGGANRGLYTELNVSMEKPWFLFEDTKIYVFADVPHLIKLIRNHFIDHGFLLNGMEVKKDIILKLLSLTSGELSITHKISSKSLNVVQAERQKVKLATKLFSHTVAKALSRAVDLGYIVDETWEECYKLFKYTNDWFDVMNVRSPYSDSRERVHAYGLHLESQNKILDDMTKLVLDMRVVGKNSLLPFQKGIVQSNTALQLLHKDVKERFGVKFIMTYRLNQDVLENFFGVIRAKGGLHDHPDRQEFKYRLRSYILGHNEGALSDNGNVGVDDTPDLGLEETSLSGRIFNVMKVNKPVLGNSEPEENLPFHYDGLENLAGYICHRFKDIIPNLEQEYQDESSWVNHLDEGGLSKPSTTVMNQLASLENVFNAVNGEGSGLYICQNYIQHLLEVSAKANITCDKRIKKTILSFSNVFPNEKIEQGNS